MSKSIVLSPSNYNKLAKARDRAQTALGEVAGSGVEYGKVSGIIDGFQALTQDLTELLANIEVVKSGRGRAKVDESADPRTPEEIAADNALADEQGIGPLV